MKDKGGRCSEVAEYFPKIQYFHGQSVWSLKEEVDLAFPCATQNEIQREDALNLLNAKCRGVFEGANMPCTNRAIAVLSAEKIDYIPGKAANAGGVAVSCLEMAQNSARIVWKRDQVDLMLREVMESIYTTSVETAKELGFEGNIQLGANTAGFRRVADAMFKQGLVFNPDV